MFLVSNFSLVGLLLRYLQGFEVVTNHSQLLLQFQLSPLPFLALLLPEQVFWPPHHTSCQHLRPAFLPPSVHPLVSSSSPRPGWRGSPTPSSCVRNRRRQWRPCPASEMQSAACPRTFRGPLQGPAHGG